MGEYITMHKDQRPAPFVVLARQLSMAIAYNSSHLDPSQAAVADRLRKQVRGCRGMLWLLSACRLTHRYLFIGTYESMNRYL